MLNNTTRAQDAVISAAHDNDTTISDLLGIIETMDEKITELADELETKTTELKELQSDFTDYKRTNPENQNE